MSFIQDMDELHAKATPLPWHPYAVAPWLVVDRENISIAEVHNTNGGAMSPGAAGDSAALIVDLVNSWPRIRAVLVAADFLRASHRAMFNDPSFHNKSAYEGAQIGMDEALANLNDASEGKL